MKKCFFLTLCLLAVCLAQSLWAVPAFNGWQTRTLSDGTAINLRLNGDEFYSYWETEDGKIALEQADGTFVVTDELIPSLQDADARRKASAMFQSTPRKAIGTKLLPPRGLVILVQFADVTFKAANDKAGFEAMLNTQGYDYDGAYGSAADYFAAQSNGAYRPVFDVIGPVTLPNDEAYYGEQESSSVTDKYIADFVTDAVDAAEALGCDFSLYDANNDGYVDIVYLIYAGKGQADGGATSTIWPHNWTLKGALYYGRTHGTGNYRYDSSVPIYYLPKYDGKFIDSYVCSGELNGQTSARAGIGTLCHEFSHVMGLPDYYVTTSTAANNGKNYTPGAWSLMDQGCYNNKGKTPVNYSIHDKFFMGWATPEFLSSDTAADCELTTDYGRAYCINGTTTAPSSAKSTTRTWYLENRQKTGWDAYLPGHGLCVWEVAYSSSNWSNNVPNNSTVGYTIVTANNLTKPYTPYTYQPTLASESGTPFPGTGNVTAFTPATGCELTDITESNGVITFKYNGGGDCHRVVTSGTGCTISPAKSCVANGEELVVTITPWGETYDFTSLEVRLGSDILDSDSWLSADHKTLTIPATAISGNVADQISISSIWTKARVIYEVETLNCTVAEPQGVVNIGGTLSLTVSPDAGFVLDDASCWDVAMGDVDLTYGTDYTYNSNTLTIPNVTDDVTILANAVHRISWMANGALHATNLAENEKITLPSAPADCAEGGKQFVGWCTDVDYSNETTAPTFAATGDAYSADTYYAVYAETITGSVASSKTASATSFSAIEGNLDENISYVGAKGTGTAVPIINSNQIRIYQGGGTLTLTANNNTTITGFTIGSSSATSITYAVNGGAASASQSISAYGTCTANNLSGTTIVITCVATDKSNRLNVNNLSVTYSALETGTTLANYTTTCGGSVTPEPQEQDLTAEAAEAYFYSAQQMPEGTYNWVIQIADAANSFLMSIEFYTSAANMIAGTYSSANGNIVIASSQLTYGGKTVNPTSVTMTLSYHATRSTASQYDVEIVFEGDDNTTYNINSTVAMAAYDADKEDEEITLRDNPALQTTHTVTWYACGDVFTTQTYYEGDPLVLPDAPGANAGKSFYGWIATEHYTGATAPTLIQAGGAVTEDVTYYAIYN